MWVTTADRTPTGSSGTATASSDKVPRSFLKLQCFRFLKYLDVNQVLYPTSAGTDTFLSFKDGVVIKRYGAEIMGLNHEADLNGSSGQFGFNSGFYPCRESPSTFLSLSNVARLHWKGAINLFLYGCFIIELIGRLTCSRCLPLEPQLLTGFYW